MKARQLCRAHLLSLGLITAARYIKLRARTRCVCNAAYKIYRLVYPSLVPHKEGGGGRRKTTQEIRQESKEMAGLIPLAPSAGLSSLNTCSPLPDRFEKNLFPPSRVLSNESIETLSNSFFEREYNSLRM